MKQKQLINFNKMKEQAEEYAKNITKNETYQMYLINAFIEGWKQNELKKLLK